MKDPIDELLKSVKGDIRNIRSVVRGKYLSPYALCKSIEEITKKMIANISEYQARRIK